MNTCFEFTSAAFNDVIKPLTAKPDKIGVDDTYSTCNVNNQVNDRRCLNLMIS